MTPLLKHDLRWAVLRLPKQLKALMKSDTWAGRVFVGGGYLRSTVTGEPVNDVDVFVGAKNEAHNLAAALITGRYRDQIRRRLKLVEGQHSPEYLKELERTIESQTHVTDNAITIRCLYPAVQIIHKWTFDSLEEVVSSFDFTICRAGVGYAEKRGWYGVADDRFYPDLAAKRLVYCSPKRIEEAGGSTLRVLKYYQKGYRTPLDSMGAVLARLYTAVDWEKIIRFPDHEREGAVATILTALLITVDPQVDPLHEAHLPATLQKDIEHDNDTSESN